jgi:very-short-patch-repair endonuclease
MPRNKIIPYNPNLKMLARKLRKEMTLSEILLWQEIRRKRYGVEFHRQVPIDEYIVDFYCHELMLAVEVDGSSHNIEKIQINDIQRQKNLEELGVNFIRFADIDVKRNMKEISRILELKIEELQKDIPLNPPSKGGLAKTKIRKAEISKERVDATIINRKKKNNI